MISLGDARGQFSETAPVISTWHGYKKLGNLVARHNSRCNILWCDGRVKAVDLGILASHKSNLPGANGFDVLSEFTVQARISHCDEI